MLIMGRVTLDAAIHNTREKYDTDLTKEPIVGMRSENTARGQDLNITPTDKKANNRRGEKRGMIT